jgi:hypothetical protein
LIAARGLHVVVGKLKRYDGGRIVSHRDFEVMKNDAAAEGIPSRRLRTMMAIYC